MSVRHLQAAQLVELAARALGKRTDAEGPGSLDPEALVHLASCEPCQKLAAEASAALGCVDELEDGIAHDASAGAARAAPTDVTRDAPADDLACDADVLDGFVVVDLEPCELRRNRLTAAKPGMAADHRGLAAIGPSRDRGQAFRSTDDQLTIDVREDSRDDCCYLYLDPAPTLDLQQIRLFVPPGRVIAYPIETGYLRYPRYLYDIASWGDIKLLYP